MKTNDLRGAARLASDATTALADLVEAMHARIASPPGVRAAPDARTSGITGLVYKSIRGVTHVVGGSVDALLGLLAPALAAPAAGPSREREAIVAALNGVLGDHLAASGNPLAITPALRSGGRPLVLEREALRERLPQAGGALLVLLHGLCMNDLQWQRDGHDHGAALAAALGFTPLYLHYNSGLHVSQNGALLAAQLQALTDAWPVPLQRLALLGHSMGGLAARSAVHVAGQNRQPWLDALSDLVFLGTPHQGAPLERAGHWVEQVVGAAPYAAPLARLARLRSAGIADLRHGFVRDEDWQPGAAGRPRHAVPLPDGVRCFAIAASTGRHGADLKGRLLGDGLVPLNSALGRHADPALALAFPPERQAVVWGTNHMQLLSSAEVQAQLQRWLAG